MTNSSLPPEAALKTTQALRSRTSADGHTESDNVNNPLSGLNTVDPDDDVSGNNNDVVGNHGDVVGNHGDVVGNHGDVISSHVTSAGDVIVNEPAVAADQSVTVQLETFTASGETRQPEEESAHSTEQTKRRSREATDAGDVTDGSSEFISKDESCELSENKEIVGSDEVFISLQNSSIIDGPACAQEIAA